MKEQKLLCFYLCGKLYEVNRFGHIRSNGLKEFSINWKFRGGIRHHASTMVNVDLEKAFEKPELLNGCLFSDIDHGTTRIRGGRYKGKLPRIEGAYIGSY